MEARTYRRRGPTLVAVRPVNERAPATTQSIGPTFPKFRAAIAAEAHSAGRDWQLGDPLGSASDARSDVWRTQLVRAILVFFFVLPAWLVLYWIQIEATPPGHHSARIQPIDGLQTHLGPPVPVGITGSPSAKFATEARAAKGQVRVVDGGPHGRCSNCSQLRSRAGFGTYCAGPGNSVTILRRSATLSPVRAHGGCVVFIT